MKNKKIEKLNSNTMNIVVSDGENASYQDQNMRLPKLNIKTFTGKLPNCQCLLNHLKQPLIVMEY